MNRKICASIEARLAWPDGLSRFEAAENLEYAFAPDRFHTATIEATKPPTLTWLEQEKLNLKVQFRLLIVADTRLEIQAIMRGCRYSFIVGDQKLESQLANWAVVDSR